MDDKLDMIRKASTSRDIVELKKLANNQYMHVRRAVARNLHTCGEVLNELAYDKVLNVAFMAIKNPNCRIQRVIDESMGTNHPCVYCLKDEIQMQSVCKNCETLKEYSS